MQIECKIRRQGGTTVDMPNEDESTTKYHFKPLDATREDSPHVADVKDMAHVSRFISAAPECYVPFEGKAPKAGLARPSAEPVLSVVELSEGIKAGTFTPEALRELLAQEEESGEPRKGFVKVITQALK